MKIKKFDKDGITLENKIWISYNNPVLKDSFGILYTKDEIIKEANKLLKETKKVSLEKFNLLNDTLEQIKIIMKPSRLLKWNAIIKEERKY